MRALPQRRLDKRVVKAWRLENIISSVLLVIVGGGTAALLYSLDIISAAWLIPIALVLLFLVVLLVGFVPPFRYVRWLFDVTKDEVDLMEGILIRKRTIIPLVRVQSVNTSQGPILRALGISNVAISTAAGTHTIPALSTEDAATLRDHISALAQVAQEDV